MLPVAIKEERSIHDIENVLSTLASGNVKPLTRVVIYRKYENEDGQMVEVPTEVLNVLSYQTSEERQFGASSLQLVASNEQGLYSYGNVNSPHNTLQITSNTPSLIDVSLSTGAFHKTTYVNSLIIDGINSYGNWTSDVINGGTDFYSWNSISWKTGAGTFSKGGTIYYSSIDILVRYGNTENTNDKDQWTAWQKIKTLSGNLSNELENFYLFSNKRFLQLQLRLHAAYNNFGSPSVQSIKLKANVKGDDYSIIPNQPLYYYGNRITVQECVVTDNGEMEWFNRFHGFINEATPSHTLDGLELKCTALDNMKMCLNGIIEKPHPEPLPNGDKDRLFEPDKFQLNKPLQLVKVTAPGIDYNEDGKIGPDDVIVTSDDEGFVYSIPYNPYEFRNNGPIRGFTVGPMSDTRGDRKLVPWVKRPDINVYVDGVHKRDGFDVDYEKGVIYFNEKPRKKDENDDGEPSVKVSFEWYDLDKNLLEDVLGEILALAIQNAGYDKPTQVVHDGFDIWESPKHNFKIILEHSLPRVTIPPIGFYLEDNKTYFDALREVLDFVQPDYLLRATPEGYFVGEHLPQLRPLVEEEAELIYSLSLVSSMDSPVSENDIFTRCVARGTAYSTRNQLKRGDCELTDNKKTATLIKHYTKPSNDENRHDLNELINGDLASNVGWIFLDEEPNLPTDMLTIKLKNPIKLGAINLLIGDGAGPPSKGKKKWGPINLNGFGVAVEVSPNNSDWYTLSEHDFTGSSGEWIRIDKSDFLPDIKTLDVKYIKIIATAAPHFERGADGTWFLVWWGRSRQEGYCWALRQIQVFPDEEIRVSVGVADLVESLSENISEELAERVEKNLLSIESRVGIKTEVLPIDHSLQTEEAVKARGLDYLYETVRNLYTSNVEVIYAPHIRMGHTVKLSNPYLLDDEAYHNIYYVDGVNTSMQGNVPTTRLSLVNWV